MCISFIVYTTKEQEVILRKWVFLSFLRGSKLNNQGRNCYDILIDVRVYGDQSKWLKREKLT